MAPGVDIAARLEQALLEVGKDMCARLEGATGAFEQAARQVFEGARSGRYYPASGGGHRASAPGEPPAKGTGEYARSWSAKVSGEQGALGNMCCTVHLVTSMPERALRLERGSGQVAARPHAALMRRAVADEVLAQLRGGG